MTSRRHNGERIVSSINVDEKSYCCNQRMKLDLYVILPTKINSKLIKGPNVLWNHKNSMREYSRDSIKYLIVEYNANNNKYKEVDFDFCFTWLQWIGTKNHHQDKLQDLKCKDWAHTTELWRDIKETRRGV